MTVRVSIIICTRDRARHLRPTLESLAASGALADGGTELLLVDNASADGTDGVGREFAARHPGVRIVRAPKPGLARARNVGLQHARGSVLAFTDDDVRFSEGWLQRLIAPILAGEAAASVGGIVIPSGLAPEWLGPPLRAMLSSTEGFTDPPPHMVGANMAFGREVLARVPAFDEELGAGALGFAEDTLFGWQLVAAGYRIRYVPEARLEHHFDSERLDVASLLRHFGRQGASLGYIAYHFGPARPRAPWLHLLRWGFVRLAGVMQPPLRAGDERTLLAQGRNAWAWHYFRQYCACALRRQRRRHESRT